LARSRSATFFAVQRFVGADLPPATWITGTTLGNGSRAQAVRRPTRRDRQSVGHSSWLRELLSALPKFAVKDPQSRPKSNWAVWKKLHRRALL
jgi:hypothetical protein